MSGMSASSSTAGIVRRWFSIVHVPFQDKDGRETSLPQAISQKQIGCGYDFGCRWGVLFFKGQIVLDAMFVFQPFLFAALSNALVAKGNQIGRVLFDASANSLGKLFQSSWVVFVLRTKVLDAHGSVLRQLEGLLPVVGIGPIAMAGMYRLYEMHDWFVLVPLIPICLLLLCFHKMIRGIYNKIEFLSEIIKLVPKVLVDIC